MSQRDRQFIASLEGGGPPEPRPELSAEIQQAWREVVAAVPAGVLCPSDRGIVEAAAELLVRWRKLMPLVPVLDREEVSQLLSVREAYRVLGELLMPMRARRGLLFPERPPRRELA